LLYLYSEIFPPMGQCCCGVMSLFKLCCQCGGEGVYGDNCCGWNHAAFSKWVNIQGSKIELVHADFEADVCRTPYAIVVDHEKKCVVLTLRGTISFKDCLTDALAEAVEFKYDAQPRESAQVFVHQGFYEAAFLIYTELKYSRLLHTLLLDGYEVLPTHNKDWLKEHSPGLHKQVTQLKPQIIKLSKVTRGYQLRVLGHSLGAGVASVLTMLLANDFSNIIHCFAYSCPGAVFSIDFAKSYHVKRLVTTVVLSDDMIPRTSLKTLERLRNRVVHALRTCNDHKCDAFETALNDKSRHEDSMLNLELPFAGVAALKLGNGCDGHHNGLDSSDQTEMAAVGQILQLARYFSNATEEIDKTRDAILLNCGNTCCGMSESGHEEYTNDLHAKWINPEELTEIKVSPTMVLDHLPDRVFIALKAVAERSQSRSPRQSSVQRRISNEAGFHDVDIDHFHGESNMVEIEMDGTVDDRTQYRMGSDTYFTGEGFDHPNDTRFSQN